MTIRPLGDKVVVKPSEAEEKSAGGIILPDAAKQKPQEGKVIAAGPGARQENGDGKGQASSFFGVHGGSLTQAPGLY